MFANYYFPFRIKQEYDNSLYCLIYANIAKNGTRSYHCRRNQSKPDKESHVAVYKNCFN